MNSSNESRPVHDESFKYAAVDFLNKNGNQVEAVAAELGINPTELRDWQKKLATAAAKPNRPLGGIAKLRAENEALRNEILQLQVQWDILKTTLGVLSTTVCSREYAG
jgi:transposase-like protein